jgi:hypothetical protein
MIESIVSTADVILILKVTDVTLYLIDLYNCSLGGLI